ncbi:hypothetical protein COV93_04710 [Candidatus Woesearchaeota archaeon CG11_big_fil_rev_8_21_14_0_20_43_8]|nr:MAG: hypothetical protein COV93_04710 [Candidatus Woesearchaeota archaeon CG11_big_fil_rev_8_21_14_0_20_43_8]PIO08945.1 MAG: hypothetical protein COT47_00495 [Candidatus Woesearchaeota archaeon CG08_land_8_20_14_0_20_43_7]
MDSKYREGFVKGLSITFTYFSLLNIVLIVNYAFKDTTYNVFETLRYHFAFYYLFFIIPFFIACTVGNKVLFTEYPKLVYVIMPVLVSLPFIFIGPSKCSFVSCERTLYFVTLGVSLFFTMKQAHRISKEHGDYVVFTPETKFKVTKIMIFVVLNIIAFAGIPVLNMIHANNDLVIKNLNAYGKNDILDECSGIHFNNQKKALCYLHSATIVNDPIVCAKIRRLVTENEDADRCYKNLAVYKSNIVYCNDILFKDIRYDCYYAFAPLNDNLCKKISDKDFQVNCFNDCQKITSKKMRDSCYFNKAQSNKDFEFCDKISDAEMQKKCYQQVVSDAKDCEKVQDIAIRDDCYEMVAQKIGTLAPCLKISSSDDRDECIRFNSQTKEDCKSISNTDIRYTCIATMANDTMTCEGLSKEVHRDLCFESVAVRLGDLSICKRIMDPTRKTVCETRVG